MALGTIYRVGLIGALVTCLVAPNLVHITVPMQSALSHTDQLNNQYLAPPSPPVWTLFHPWPFERRANSELIALINTHRNQFELIEAQKDKLRKHSLRLAQLLPEKHLQHAALKSGELDCRLGDCQIWIQINNREFQKE